ncbi:hypothetical protein [Chitinophaga sp. RAB17]|uniref:hypothetical protein n=1 Tax=Chitinophaga sp. RAB17 TaxID=3233049 RepID=UPI003F933B2E
MKQLFLILLATAVLQGVYAQTKPTEIPSFRITVNGGYSYRLGKISSEFSGEAKDYLKKLKSGFNVGADAMHYFRESMGVGVKYNLFHTAHSDVIPVTTGSGTMRAGVMDNISISFYAATFGTRIFNAAKTNAFYANVALGYLGFRDNGWVEEHKLILSGGTVGIGWDAGYDFRITRRLSAGAQLSLISGQLTRITKEDATSTQTITLKDEQKENLSHLNLSAGLRLNL